MKKDLRNKPFVVIDLGSGSYCRDNEGHEKYNEIPNPVTGEFYGYAPPLGKIDISKLGAKKSEDKIDDVLVIYVKTQEYSKDRVISSFIESATVYRNPQSGKLLKRKAKSSVGYKDCTYCIQSANLVKIEDIPGIEEFVIKLSDYNAWMFRGQRFYKGTYPSLDVAILNYIEGVISKDKEADDYLFQESLQTDKIPDVKKTSKNSEEEPQYTNSINGNQVKKKIGVSKTSLLLADYKCQANKEHKTFINKSGKPYMEGHHLIPCTSRNAKIFWDSKRINIDCIENIVCLCPTCHRQIHYGSHEERIEILQKLLSIKEVQLKSIGIEITLEELLKFYE